jgi:hypothetical protein
MLLIYTAESDQVEAINLKTPDDGSVWAETYVGLSDILSFILVKHVGYVSNILSQ